jgi:peptide deformylase
VIADMHEALSTQDDGVAIAAPQIGVSKRIFIVSRRVFLMDRDGNWVRPKEELDNYDDVVFINPVILNRSKKQEWMPEGCLSVRWKYGRVARATKATVRAYNEKGEEFTRNGSGLWAQIFQHEIDHLNGLLFIDKAKHVEQVEPPESED